MSLKRFDKHLVLVGAALLATNTFVHANSSTDDRIEAAAKGSHTFKTYLKEDSINVDSNKGVVKLTGTVMDDNHKALARETVASLPGVQRVDDQLSVKTTANQTGNSDQWISTKIKTMLMFHQNVSATKTNVDVQGGNVRLTGEADSQTQKDLTTEYVRDVEGVRDVKNDLMIVSAAPDAGNRQTAGEKIDDASITAQSKLALVYHRSTSALRTKVETNEGLVTVWGKAKSSAEKDLVTQIVSDIKGVKGVMNKMTIESGGKS